MMLYDEFLISVVQILQNCAGIGCPVLLVFSQSVDIGGATEAGGVRSKHSMDYI